MKKLFLIALTSIALLTGISFADFTSFTAGPANQVAISGSLVSRSVHITNATGDAYVIVKLPQTANYNLAYQNASLLPINNSLLQLGVDHDPIFFINSGATLTLSLTGKMITSNRGFTPTTVRFLASDTGTFTSVFTSAIATVSSIADLMIQKIITGTLPMISGDLIHYIVTVTNLGSADATGVQLADSFPIPLFGLPSAIVNGSFLAYDTPITYPNTFLWTGGAPIQPGQSMTFAISAALAQQVAPGTSFTNIAKAITASSEYTTGNNSATVTATIVAPADLYIHKTMQAFTGYQLGSVVTYTITYGNSGGTAAQNVVIQDIASTGIYISTTTRNIAALPAGSGGTMTFTGVLTASMQAGQTLVNKATITSNQSEISTGNNTATVTGTIVALANITLDMQAYNDSRPQLNTPPHGSGTSIMIQAASGDQVTITIHYGNNGNTSAANAVLALAGLQGFTHLGTYNGTLGNLAIGQTGTIIITGIVGPQNYISFTPTATLTYNSVQTILDSVTIQEPLLCGDGLITRTEPCDTLGQIGLTISGQVCENHGGSCVAVTKNITNTACIDYRYTLGSGHICSSVQFPIESIGQCKTLDIHGTNVVLADENNGTYQGDADFTCSAQTGIAQTIAIDCGNGEVHTGTNLASFDATCHFDEHTIPANRTVQCYVDGQTQNSCQQKMVIDQAEFGVCGDGIIQGYENCDLGDNNQIIGDYLDEQGDVDAGEYANDGYTCHNCDIQKKDVQIPQAACFSVNGNNISVQQNEILPFRWKVDVMQNTLSTDNNGDCTPGEINKDSMECEFRLFNGAHQESNDDELYTKTVKCNTDERTANGDFGQPQNLFRYFYDQRVTNNIRSLQDPFGRYYLNFQNINLNGIYGEYNLALYQVRYDYCNADKQRVAGTPIDRVCETDFAVTKPYLAQKSSFGLTPKATTVNLDGYKDIFGNDIVKKTDLDQIMVLDANTYKGGSTINSLMTTFVNKYSKLAITVEKSKVPSLNQDGITSIKIVPQQKIFILEGAAGTTVTLNPNLVSDTPFTIVTKNINLVVEGDLTTNGMFLVDNGTITFQEPDAKRCDHTQTVQGIFVTNKGFAADQEGLSNDATSKTRCPYGGLSVKGVLIGNNIETLVQSRRSQLNGWFMVNSSSDAAVLAERRNEIFKGAAVLIEYSPSLRTALPPGANEFTKALDVYKK